MLKEAKAKRDGGINPQNYNFYQISTHVIHTIPFMKMPFPCLFYLKFHNFTVTLFKLNILW